MVQLLHAPDDLSEIAGTHLKGRPDSIKLSSDCHTKGHLLVKCWVWGQDGIHETLSQKKKKVEIYSCVYMNAISLSAFCFGMLETELRPCACMYVITEQCLQHSYLEMVLLTCLELSLWPRQAVNVWSILFSSASWGAGITDLCHRPGLKLILDLCFLPNVICAFSSDVHPFGFVSFTFLSFCSEMMHFEMRWSSRIDPAGVTSEINQGELA